MSNQYHLKVHGVVHYLLSQLISSVKSNAKINLHHGFPSKHFISMRPKVRLWIRLASLISYLHHFETVIVMNVVCFGSVHGTSSLFSFLNSAAVCCEHRVIWGRWARTRWGLGPVYCSLFSGRKAFKPCFMYWVAIRANRFFPLMVPAAHVRVLKAPSSLHNCKQQ